MSNVDRGDEFMAQGDKKLKAFSFFSGGSSKYEDAAELYTKGANSFKVAKKWEKAGAAFIKAAECYMKVPSKHEAATSYVAAANVLKNSSSTDAINAYKTAVELYVEEGRFSIAAKHQKEVAELQEKDLDFEGCIESYQTAADYHEGENSTAAASSCLAKVAQYSAQLEKYDKAIDVYEDMARKSLDNSLTKWSVKNYFFKAILCYILQTDVITAKRQLDKYQEMDYSFGSQRECKFLQEIIAAYEAGNVEEFTQAVVEYDSISKLDQWTTTMLLRVKDKVKDSGNSIA